jgi:hypothetical protein
MSSPDPSPSRPAVREIRSVRADRAFAWYAEALRLFKRQPVPFALLAIGVVVVEVGLLLIPLVGPPAANIIVPIVASALLFAALATDRGDRPRAMHFIAPFAAPLPALPAVAAATLLVSGAAWLAGWHFAGTNILLREHMGTLSVQDTLLIYSTGVVVSLPLTLVPLLAFFENASVRDAFAGSIDAFVRNVPAFLLYGGLSVALLGIVFVTQGIAAPIVLPLWAISSYAAWKDLYGAT